MSDTFYHVDRKGSLAEGEVITLEHPKDLEDDLEQILRDYYPEGLSKWGRSFADRDLFVFTESAANTIQHKFSMGKEVEINEIIQTNGLKEAIFEFVRLAEFPQQPSRFQSIFGAKDFEQATIFADNYADKSVIIWEVKCAEYFIADMKLLDTFNSFSSANQYWQGETFLEEPLWEALLVPPIEVRCRVEEYEPS